MDFHNRNQPFSMHKIKIVSTMKQFVVFYFTSTADFRPRSFKNLRYKAAKGLIQKFRL